jgi:hypothetical protein
MTEILTMAGGVLRTSSTHGVPEDVRKFHENIRTLTLNLRFKHERGEEVRPLLEFKESV